MNRLRLLSAALFLAAASAARAQYAFTNVADRSSPLYNSFGVP